MNHNQANCISQIKRRKSMLAAFLSLISLGLGQVYNGELWKGLSLNIIFLTLFLWNAYYTSSAYYGNSFDLIFLVIAIVVFLLLKIYSIVQAYMQSVKRGDSFRRKLFNRFYFYIIWVGIWLVLPFSLANAIKQHSLQDISSHHPFRSEKAKAIFLNDYDKTISRWPVVSQTRIIGSSFGQTFVRISGPEEAPALVLLHGGPSNSGQWIPNIKALSQTYRTYAIDIIIGTGRSVCTRNLKRPAELVQWLEETLNGLGLKDEINLVGLSYGGWVTSQYALAHSDRLSKIILIAPVGTVSIISWKWIQHALLSTIPHRHFMKNFFCWLLDDFARKDKAELNRLIDESFLAMRCFKPKMPVSPTVLTDDELKKIDIPVLFIIGEKEKIYPQSAKEIVRRINHLAPRIKTEMISGAGHDLTFVQADRVNHLILKFLKHTIEKTD